MDRQIVYPGAIPLETDLLSTNKNAMVGLSKLAAAVLGTGTFLNGLACTPTGPASLQVYVAPGEIYSLQNIDGTAYSSLAADTTHQIVKQGISLDQVTLSCPAPVTAGQSINYLVQVAYQDTDSGATVLPYYNASNPAQAYSGPSNSGTAQNTVRKGSCVISAKAGVAATTGSQVTPSPDAGYVGAYVVTVTNGQTQITSSSISILAGAPFLPAGGLVVGGIQNNVCNSSVAGGTSDAITGGFSPGITALPAAGSGVLTLYVRAGSANTTTTPTFTPNSGTIAAKTIVKGAGAALAAGDIAGAGHWLELQFDATLDKWVLQNPATGISSVGVGYLMVRDERSSGTTGGASSVGTQTRTLNTVSSNTISGASLASNQITLPAGTYRVRAKAPTIGVNNTQAWLYNVTDASTPIRGTSENGQANSAGDPMTISSFVDGRFSIAATKVFELRQYCNEVHPNGLGAPVSQGAEVYTTVEILKEA